MEQSSALRLPLYQSHKVVRAAKIIAIDTQDTGQGTLTLEIPADIPTRLHCHVTSSYLQKHQPQVGGFYVLYNDGYESFSPAEAFEEGYALLPGVPADWAKSIPSAGIGWAVKQMQNGQRVCRAGWNGKGMFLFLVPGSTFTVNRPPLLGIYREGTEINYCPHVDMKTADGKVVPWLASQTDLLAIDWEIAV